MAFPASLSLLWSSTKYARSLKGPAPVFTDVPTVDADGVAPGDGPSFTSAVVWTDGGTRVWEITMATASADLVGDVEIGGGFYAYSGGLKFKDGVNTASVSASWADDEVVTGAVQVVDGVMRIARGEGM